MHYVGALAGLQMGLEGEFVIFVLLGNFGQFPGLCALCSPATGLTKRKLIQVNICLPSDNSLCSVHSNRTRQKHPTSINKLAKLRRHARRVHFARIHFG